MNILEEFWYGHINPQEGSKEHNRGIKNLLPPQANITICAANCSESRRRTAWRSHASSVYPIKGVYFDIRTFPVSSADDQKRAYPNNTFEK